MIVLKDLKNYNLLEIFSDSKNQVENKENREDERICVI